MAGTEADRVLEKLAKDVEAAVHALYRGEVRQQTAKARTGNIVREAQQAMAAAMHASGAGAAPLAPGGASPRPSVAAPVIAGGAAGWSREEGDAVMKCITAWLPMGSPKDALPDSKCVAAMRDLTPSWGQREKAREAVRRISQP